MKFYIILLQFTLVNLCLFDISVAKKPARHRRKASENAEDKIDMNYFQNIHEHGQFAREAKVSETSTPFGIKNLEKVESLLDQVLKEIKVIHKRSSNNSKVHKSIDTSSKKQVKTNSDKIQSKIEKWNEWTEWSKCSVTCGKGRKIRWRYCVSNNCEADTEMDEKTCQMPECAPFTIFR